MGGGNTTLAAGGGNASNATNPNASIPAGDGTSGNGTGGGAGGGNNNNKKCDKKLNSDDHKRLRRGTPSPELRDRVNSGTPPLICPACGKTTDKFQADHIVPLKIIKKIPGFACLSPENQEKVSNNPLNFVGLCGPCNASKGSKLWHKWMGHSKNGLVGADVKKRGIEITRGLIVELKNQIKGMPW